MSGPGNRPSEGSDDNGRHPLVSVIMATYNCEQTLPAALQSLADQTYPNWELVVCDDASTDGSLALLDDFAASSRVSVTVLRNEVNSKLSFSLNRCLASASGELIARMDGDDLCHPERLERQVGFLEDQRTVDLVGTAIQRFDDAGPFDVLRLDEKPDRWSMRGDVPFVHATVLVRRRVYDALGGYTVSPRTVRGQDKDLWFRFLSAGYVGMNLSDPLYLVREDRAALRRRTFLSRWNSYRTTLIGYRMLGYPKSWYIAPTLALAKGAIPSSWVPHLRRARRSVASSATDIAPR